jgi:glycosyltransferase involved in cell wall biosynthesis
MNLTVIIPAKPRTPQDAEWLKVAVASIPEDAPVVLVDDHSPLDWAEVRKVCKFDKRIKVKHMPEGKTGLAATRNLAMSFVKTEFFFPLDADDYLAENALQIAMDSYPGDGFLYGSTILFDDKKRSTYLARPYDICKLLDAVYWPNGCLQKTENWQKLGGWDETLLIYEDWDYWLRSFKAGIFGHPIQDVLYCYRQNPAGIIHTLRRSPDMTVRARDIIHARHEDLYSGEHPMCSGCGNKNKDKDRSKAKTVSNDLVDTSLIHLKASEGMVLMTFIGTGMTRSFYGGKTGTCYRFSDSRRKRGYVAEEDVPSLLAMRENGKKIFVMETPK